MPASINFSNLAVVRKVALDAHFKYLFEPFVLPLAQIKLAGVRSVSASTTGDEHKDH